MPPRSGVSRIRSRATRSSSSNNVRCAAWWRGQQAEEKARQREDALAIAAHELRNPVSAQRLAIDLLLRAKGPRDVDAAAARLLPKVKRASERIALLVEELTELTILRHGRLDLRLEEFDLADSITHLVDDHRSQLEEVSTEITLDAEPVVGRWDRLRIEQVVTNLLANAEKYGEGKPSAVLVRGDVNRARIVVEDHGPGINREDQDRVFGRSGWACTSAAGSWKRTAGNCCWPASRALGAPSRWIYRVRLRDHCGRTRGRSTHRRGRRCRNSGVTCATSVVDGLRRADIDEWIVARSIVVAT